MTKKLNDLIQYRENLLYTINELQEQLNQVEIDIQVEESKQEAKKELKKSKVTKLTATQEKAMEKIKNADWYYMDGKESINYDTFIDGKFLTANQGYYIMGNSRFSTEMSTNTLRALEKKGALQIEKASDNGFLDLVIVPEIKTKNPFQKLWKVTFKVQHNQYEDIIKTAHVYTLAEQVEDAITAYEERSNTSHLQTLSMELVDVTTWNMN